MIVPMTVPSLAEVLGEEMAERGWTIEDVGARMGNQGAARDALSLALAMSVQSDRLRLDDAFMGGLARAFDVSAEFFRNLHLKWLAHPEAREPYVVPDSLFGPWLRTALASVDGDPKGENAEGG